MEGRSFEINWLCWPGQHTIMKDIDELIFVSSRKNCLRFCYYFRKSVSSNLHIFQHFIIKVICWLDFVSNLFFNFMQPFWKLRKERVIILSSWKVPTDKSSLPQVPFHLKEKWFPKWTTTSHRSWYFEFWYLFATGRFFNTDINLRYGFFERDILFLFVLKFISLLFVILKWAVFFRLLEWQQQRDHDILVYSSSINKSHLNKVSILLRLL